ncbi:MAG TPA: endonuclease/exonuclease/phosphatase family protein [Pseudonocardiaceae bacterium]|nr:endonuclease/exonuclease/phosphatase family protein [Pseudonocardiaceae bacterium]
MLTWNVQHAAASRTYQQAVWLATADPHEVLVLTEVAAGESGELLARLLRESGYTVHLPDAGQDKHRVLIACRTGVLDVVSDTGVGFLPHRCVAIRVKLPQTEIGVVGLYVPSRGPQHQRNVAKRAFQEIVTFALPDMSGVKVSGPVAITGDLNVVEPSHELRYAVFGGWEYDFYRSFIAAGFTDAFRFCHPKGMDYSWFGRNSGDGRRNGYRFDHVFITTSRASAVRECRYLHAIRENGLSDHAAMTLTADL